MHFALTNIQPACSFLRCRAVKSLYETILVLEILKKIAVLPACEIFGFEKDVFIIYPNLRYNHIL
jgi:hypothetical protein